MELHASIPSTLDGSEYNRVLAGHRQVSMNTRWKPRRKAIPRDAIAAAAVVRKGNSGGDGYLMGKQPK